MKIIKQAVCFTAGQLLLSALAATSLFAQTSGVPLDFGGIPGDLLLAYGFQYQAMPRHSGATSDAYLLPGTASYNLAPQWTVRVDATTLKSVDYTGQPRATGFGDMDTDISFAALKESLTAPGLTVDYTGQPRATGFGDMDTDISFAALKESLTAPGLTVDYQVNLPTGDSTDKLGTGQFGHRFTAGVVKGRNSWTYQLSAGDLLGRKKSGYDYSNAIFTSFAATYTFPKKDLSNAVPTLKNEIDFIPAYASNPQTASTSTPKITVPTEIYLYRCGGTPRSL